MAKKQYLDLEGLTTYDEKIKSYIDSADAATSTKLANGTVTVKEAQHATSATNATNATNANHAVSADSADTATKAGQLTTSRTISLTGDASGSVSFNGTQDVSITVTVADDSHNHVISNIDGLQTALNGKSDSGHDHDNDYYAKTSGEQLAATLEGVKEDVDTFFKDADFTTNAKDTLKEIQTYINSDAQAAADMLASINNKAEKTDLTTHTNNEDIHVTATKKSNWDAAYSHSTSNHAPSNAQANVIESIKVNGATQTISSKSVNITVPTDNNQLTNGAGYLVANDIIGKADKTTVDAVSAVANEAKSAASTNAQAISANTQSITSLGGRVTTLEGLDAHEAIPTTSITALFS